jgi:hypothetical protein
MHHQIELLLNGPTYVTILSSQEEKDQKLGKYSSQSLQKHLKIYKNIKIA